MSSGMYSNIRIIYILYYDNGYIKNPIYITTSKKDMYYVYKNALKKVNDVGMGEVYIEKIKPRFSLKKSAINFFNNEEFLI